ncbi:hypothetical protein FLONG3_5068 [Fusarium longipes]|uniref:DUF7136 domain-containing protein n=1 Tax=Fusarium longipes TaxID=694270 RepID=A0A395SXY8_9HYPO|nr:hypothetical protein FLONG3_5068 [Fusarium longipes]
MIFPRNETYNPSPVFPFVFSYGDPKMIPIFEPVLHYDIYDYHNHSDYGRSVRMDSVRLPEINDSSSNPYIEANLFRDVYTIEGTWIVRLTVYFKHCHLEARLGEEESIIIKGDTAFITDLVFTTKGPLKQIDLGAATSKQTCPGPGGITINATHTTVGLKGYDFYAERQTCAFVDEKVDPDGFTMVNVQKDPDRCAVTLEPTAVSSIDTRITTFYCGRHGDEENDPKGLSCDSWRESQDNSESTGRQIVAGGVTCLAFVFGVILYIHTLM